jgi:cytidylate kinase
MEYNTLVPFLEIHEHKICERLQITSVKDIKGPLIAIGGLSGVGKDTLAENLKNRLNAQFGLNLKIFSAGSHIREYARRKGYNGQRLDEFLQKVKDDEIFARDVDHFADKQTLSAALGQGQGIFVGRMAPFVIGKWGVTIWITVDPKRRALRLINDGNRPEYGLSEEEVYDRIARRDQNDVSRLERIYKISLDLSEIEKKVNLILDNTDNTIDQTTEIAYQLVVKQAKLNNKQIKKE